VELLSGTGQGPWAILFNAAREFSIAAAFQGRDFPVTDDGARCVLCQQELDPNAKMRLTKFDRYIRDTASAQAQAARTAWQKQVRELGEANVDFSASPIRP
jgi:hypothetical protein